MTCKASLRQSVSLYANAIAVRLPYEYEYVIKMNIFLAFQILD